MVIVAHVEHGAVIAKVFDDDFAVNWFIHDRSPRFLVDKSRNWNALGWKHKNTPPLCALCAGGTVLALPTGMGKTSAIAAFVAALHRLDIGVAVAVAASKVEALCDLKRKLVRLGVAEAKVGLKHSLDTARNLRLAMRPCRTNWSPTRE